MKRSFRPMTKCRQTGISLVIALVFLVVLTMLGLGMFFSTKSEEAMARNFRDKEITLHAAEAALNEAKMLITGSYDASAAPTPLPRVIGEQDCNKATKPHGFICNDQPLVDVDLFPASGTPPGDALSTYGSSLSPEITGGLVAQPRYLVVRMQDAKFCSDSTEGDCFQIIAQARGRLGNTRVNLIELFAN